MSDYSPVPTDAQLHFNPKDHSWVTEDINSSFFAQASYIVNPDDISISLSANNINVDLDQTNAGIQTINTNLSAVTSDLNTNLSTVNVNLSAVEETLVGIDIDLNTNLSVVNANLSTLVGIDIDLNTNLSVVNANLSTVNTNLENILSYNSFVIPSFDNIALTNDTAGNPLSAVYSKNSSTVATLVFDYDGSEFLINTRIVYPS